MDSTKNDSEIMDFLTSQLNNNPAFFAVRINDDTVYITLKEIKGDAHITLAHYFGGDIGRDFLVKYFEDGSLIFENITTTPVALINTILVEIMLRKGQERKQS